jgi:hypothetical protein
VCGLLQNGSALCWGRNDHGQIGNNSVGVFSSMPTFVSGNHNFTFISAGNEKVCGILINQTSLCWGTDDSGSESGCMGGLGDGGCEERHVPYPTYGDYHYSSLEAQWTWTIRNKWNTRNFFGSSISSRKL